MSVGLDLALRRWESSGFFRDLILPRKIFPLAEHISRGGKGPEGEMEGGGSRDGCSRFTPCLFSAARSLMSELNKHQRRGSGPNPTPEREECLRRKISFDGLPRETKRSVARPRMRAGATAASNENMAPSLPPPPLQLELPQPDRHSYGSTSLSLRRGS